MESIGNMTNAQMVAEYNELTGKNIMKFSSRKAGEKQLSAARKTHKRKEEKVEKEYNFDEEGCPHCGAKDGQQAVAESDDCFSCQACGSVYDYNSGLIVKKPVANIKRAEAVSQTWKDPEVRARRAERTGVLVDGKHQYKSVAAAFRALDLPMGAHIGFRMRLKKEKKLVYSLDENTKHEFTVLENA